ncbi:hypothetical protein HYE82_24780 [Streptomyces sp. BR123]|uniref:hypothetical protein n=1 Tax=Streptomyces sp. BR123 TaxID=2749828 RepID=UPI0015C4B1CF|nr:hypothetical protein [Streptomyces sp. BR123]NXY97531.1 hypothetical protein [Streptomyces sp. BR123]
MEEVLVYRALLAVDIERSAGRGNVALWQIRDALRTALSESFEESGIDWAACSTSDLGDGLRVVAPAGVPKARLIHPLVHELAIRLRAHNRTAGPLTQVRVRAALHAGEVRAATDGEVTGRPLEVLARLLDAAAVRGALAAAPPEVTTALIVSQHVYEETVRHGYPGIDPESFHRIAVAEKEYTTDAWLHLAGSAPDPRQHGADAENVGSPQDPPPAHRTARMVNTASGNGAVYATQYGTQNIHVHGRT